MDSRAKDFTPEGMRLEGQYENDRNADYSDLFKMVIRKVYNVKDVIIGHHLIYATEEKREDGFTYQIVQEIPSADALIFSHEIAKVIFGEDRYQECLKQLACEPADTRNDLYAKLVTAAQ